MSPPHITDADAPRPARPVRLVALDLDGTCLDVHQRLAPRTRDAVRATVAAGTTVVIATGRMFRSALPWAREMGVVAPLLCYQGALVREQPRPDGDGTPGPVLFEDPVGPAAAERALTVAREGNWHYQAYQDDLLLCEEDRPEAHLYARIAQVEIHFVDDLAPVVRRGTTKIVCVVEELENAARCEAAMRAALDGEALVTRSLPQFVEITNPIASKGRALRRLCEQLAIPIADTVAVGDAPNDSDMLKVAGYSVAVQGAPDRLLAHADAVCATAENAGVADVLIALGLAR